MVSFIIVTFNSEMYVSGCLTSILKFSYQFPIEIIVIDNNSSDGTLELLKEFPDSISLINNKENIGFAKACNQGIKNAKGKYVFLLNPDTQFINDSLTVFYNYMERMENSMVWCLGGQLYDRDKVPIKSARRFPSLLTIIFEQSGLKTLIKLIVNKRMMNFSSAKKRKGDNYYILGCDMFIRREALKSIGLFNESFFLNYEEAELSWRAKKKGYKSLILPDAKIVHYAGKSFPDLKTYLSLLWIGQLLFFKMTKNRLVFFIAKSFHLLGASLRLIFELDKFYLQHLKKIYSL